MRASTGPLPPDAQNAAPRVGRGEVRFQSSTRTQIDQGCSASSITQLLCTEYDREYSEDTAVWLATEVQRRTGNPNGTPLDISDVWWTALISLLPEGPWPGLMVVLAQQGRIYPDRSCLFRIPGPADNRTLYVLGDGRHFDPIWWHTPTSILSSPPDGRAPPATILPTLTPNMGPAAGTLFLCRAKYLGYIPFAPNASHEYSQAQADNVMQGNGQWQAWIRRWHPGNGSLATEVGENLAAIGLQCADLIPPYSVLTTPAQGISVLVAARRVLKAIDNTTSGTLFILALTILDATSDNCSPSEPMKPRPGFIL